MKKTICTLLSFFMLMTLVACQPKVQENKETQAKFDEYLEELFNESITSDFMSYHFYLVEPEKKGLEKPEVTLGELTLESVEEGIEDSKEELKELHEFNVLELNQEQRNLYKSIEFNLSQSIKQEDFLDFFYAFETNGVNDYLITNFTEYRIDDVEDAKDYIVLLNDAQRFLEEGVAQVKAQRDRGNVQNEETKEYVITQAKKFLESEEIQKHFKEEIKDLNLSDEEKLDLEKQVADAVENSMKEGYRSLIKCYEELPQANYQSLAELENGKEYYAWVLESKMGSSKSVEEWKLFLENAIDQEIEAYIKILFTVEDIEEEVASLKLPTEDLEGLLKVLEKSVDEEFPTIEKVNYTVDVLDESVSDETTVAYYVSPPIDQPNLNVIKVNPKYLENKVDLFMTLSHEGWPGHLYQSNYLVQNSRYDIYRLISNLAYMEGWANYVGTDSYRICGIGSEAVQEYLRFNQIYGYLISIYYDIMVNYYGWDIDQMKEDMVNKGANSEVAEEIYESLVSMPAVYGPYGLGMYEFIHLKEKAQDELKDQFDVKQFNQVLLDVGPLTLDVVEEAVDRYIEENK